MNTTAFDALRTSLSSSDRELVSYADFAVRQGNQDEARRAMGEVVRVMDDIDAGFAMVEAIA